MLNKKIVRGLLVIALVLCVASLAFGVVPKGIEVPKKINYQGTLTDAGGQPLSGDFDMTFSIYSVATGGVALWTEVWDTTNKISVSNGTFNVMLGGKNPFAYDFFSKNTATYLGIKVGADNEMAPRQVITSVGYALTAGNGVPKGGIIMWSGLTTDIPEGWALCDGIEKTLPDGTKVMPPDLRNRFVVGAGSGYAVGATGGSATVNLQHSHIVNDHTHTYSGSGTTGGPNDVSSAQSGSSTPKPSGTHVHSFSYSGTVSGASNRGTDNSTLSTAQNILPPYYALAYIMKL